MKKIYLGFNLPFVRFKKRLIRFVLFLLLVILLNSTQTSAQILWSSSGGSAWLTGANWTGSVTPTSIQFAQFGTNPTSASSGIGIDMGGATNNGSNNQVVGGIEVSSLRTLDLLIGNSSTSVDGILTLSGTTINSVNNVVLRNNSSNLFTIQNTQGSGTQIMQVRLNNTTENIINIDGTGGIIISSSITGAPANPLTLSGSGSGILSLIGANTYTGFTNVAANTLQLNKTGGGTLPITNNILVSGTGNLRISSNQTLNNLTLSTGATLTVDNGVTLTINGTFNQNGGTIVIGTGSIVYGTGATLSYGGITAQITTDAEFSSPNTSGGGPTNLTINNPAGVTFNFAGAKLIDGVLNLNNGILYNSIPLGLNSSASLLGVSNTSFVNGKVTKIGNTPFVFPVGKAVAGFTGYVPIEITNPILATATDSYTAEYLRTSAYNLGPITATGLQTITNLEYFNLDRTVTNPLSTMDVTLHWTAETSSNGSPGFIGPSTIYALVVAHFGGSNWDTYGTTSTAVGTPTSGTVAWSTPAPSVYGAFAIGSIDFANPLPINLNYLNGTKQNTSNYLNWQVTCGVTNSSATMSLERSADGRNFASITTITADAVRCQQPFDYTDKQPLPGMNYYRLKMVDVNGKVTYSSIIAILNKEAGFDIIGLMPTLVTNNAVLNVTAAKKTKMDVVVTDVTGKQVQKIAYNLIAGSNLFTMNLENLAAGTYQINGYTTDGKSRTIRFVKQ